jgi:hypothetical protein
VFQDRYREIFGQAASAAVLTQSKREMVHAIWLLLMDKEFIEIYQNGFICRFVNGIIRRAFVRFHTHSVDYPEK